jgi:hypothetical protein
LLVFGLFVSYNNIIVADYIFIPLKSLGYPACAEPPLPWLGDMSDTGTIKKLDYPNASARQSLLPASQRISSPSPSEDRNRGSLRDHFFERVAEGLEENDKERIKTELVKYLSFVWSVISWFVLQSQHKKHP